MLGKPLALPRRPASAFRALLKREAAGGVILMLAGLLAFPTSPELQDQVKTGVLVGSVLSARAGASVLLLTKPASQTTVTRS